MTWNWCKNTLWSLACWSLCTTSQCHCVRQNSEYGAMTLELSTLFTYASWQYFYCLANVSRPDRHILFQLFWSSLIYSGSGQANFMHLLRLSWKASLISYSQVKLRLWSKWLLPTPIPCTLGKLTLIDGQIWSTQALFNPLAPSITGTITARDSSAPHSISLSNTTLCNFLLLWSQSETLLLFLI